MSDKFDVDGRRMIEVPTGGGGGGSGGVAIQAGTQTATSGTVNFAGSNNISFGMSNSSRVTASYNFNYSAGTTSNNLNSIVWSNSNNVSFGLSAGTMTATAAGIASLANSQTTYSSGLISISGANALTIRSSAGQIYQFDVPFQSVETAQWRLDGTANSIVGGTTASTVNVNSMRIRPVGGISAGFDLNDVIELSVAAQTVQTQNLIDVTLAGNTAGTLALISSGTMTLAGGNNITLSQNGNAVTISGAAAGGAQTGISGIQVSNTTYTSGTVTFQNANGASFGSSGANGVSLSYTVPTVTNSSLTLSDNATSMTIGRLAFTNSNGLTMTLSTTTGGSATLIGSYTVPTVTNSSLTLSDNATSMTIGRLAFTNSNGLTLTLSTTTGGSATLVGSYTVPTVTNSSLTLSDNATSMTIGRLAFTNSNGMTLTLSTTTGGSATLVGSYTVPSTAGLISAINVSGSNQSNNVTAINFNTGNNFTFFWDGTNVQGQWGLGLSAGTTSRTVQNLTFSNTNNISWGLFGGLNNTSKISASYEFDLSAGTFSSGINALTISDSNGIFWGLNGGTLTAIAGYLSYFENQPWLVATGTQTQGNSTQMVLPFILPQPGSFSYMRMPITMSSNSTSFASTNTGTAFSGSQLSTIYAVVYSLGTGGNSRSLQSVTSGSGGISEQLSFSVSGGAAAGTRYSVSYKITYPSEGASNSTFSTSTAQSSTRYDINSESAFSNFNGMRYMDIPFAASLSAGAYWLAFGVSSTTSTQSIAALTGAAFTYSNWCATQPNQGFGIMGSATNSSNGLQVGIGSFTTNAMTTGSIALSLISTSGSHMHPYFQLIRQN